MKSTAKTATERAVEAQREKDKEREREREGTLGRCSVSGAPLSPPLVTDRAGQVSNKLQTIAALLEQKLPPSHAHVRSAKRDLVDLRVATEPIDSTKGVTVGVTAGGSERMVCSLSGTPVDGHHRFEAAVPCGCVIATSAWDALAATGTADTCPACGLALQSRLPLNPPPHLLGPALQALRADSERRRARKRKREKEAAP